MKIASRIAWVSATLLGLGLAAGSVCLAEDAKAPEAQQAQGSEVYDGLTRPWELRALNFNSPGIIREVKVKEGDRVKVGDELMIQDDRAEQKAMAELEIDAKSTTKVEYSQTEKRQKEVKLKRIKKLRNEDNAASVEELEEAELDLQLAETRLKLSEEELAQKKLEFQKQQVKVDQMHLFSTVDGIVETVHVKAGELVDFADPTKPPIVVVQNNPLKVEVHLPTSLAAKLQRGQELEVSYDSRDSKSQAPQWTKAKITYFDPVADAGSNTRLLHLELPNPDNKESGWQVQVRVPQELLSGSASAPQAGAGTNQ